ncbi:hypothetical protein ASPACDRAFT_59805 [Aspergillus aculeatus ATCC 16872]|uniref:DEAD/DEAH-box helicase domain-containing protein n=1 Tax=Aspergillus aculeatus (strain ATCC 16872 / CBS 172.66 / WB 5094) TaxID=690307 RepID=A0A1L9WXY2_ASPA1|nr:uncharacterized protein ASPACDRAFT_59805 [Aspergillus aculeatus ATCC 16872]OJK01003.1 hypothetical protein ASPACDRAFT_59805 [Aspergillus aculeatus ATCC 16872]
MASTAPDYAINPEHCLTGRTTAALLTVVFARSKSTIFVTSTKEAAVQAAGIGNIIALSHGTLTVSCLVGLGGPASPLSSTREAQRLIVTTPGKLFKDLRNREIVPEDVSTVILDEGDTLLDTESGCGHHCPLALQSLSAASPTLLVISNTTMPIPAAMQAYHSQLVTIESPDLWKKRGNINYLLSPKSTRFEEIRKLLSEAGDKKPATTLLAAETIAQAESLQKFLGNKFTLVHSRLLDDVRFERVTQFNKGQISLIGCRVPSSGPELAVAQLVMFFEPPARWGDLADLLEKLDDHGNLYICYDPEILEETNRIRAVQANFESAKKGQMITNQSGGRRLDPIRRVPVTGIPRRRPSGSLSRIELSKTAVPTDDGGISTSKVPH